MRKEQGKSRHCGGAGSWESDWCETPQPVDLTGGRRAIALLHLQPCCSLGSDKLVLTLLQGICACVCFPERFVIYFGPFSYTLFLDHSKCRRGHFQNMDTESGGVFFRGYPLNANDKAQFSLPKDFVIIYHCKKNTSNGFVMQRNNLLIITTK